jgi:hypothetical protein
MSIFELDSITILLSAILLFLTLLSAVLNPFLRFKRRPDTSNEATAEDDAATDADAKLPPLSIIIAPHDQAESLERNLPELLSQDYPSGYVVIVVRDVSDRNTDDVLKRVKEQYEAHADNRPHDATLYVTSIQDSSRFMSRRKLAITLGIKAAKTEWVLLTEAFSRPASDQWLKQMARTIDDDCNLVVGYTAYDDNASAFMRFERLYREAYLMREDDNATAYHTLSTCLMLRKSEFMEGDGYLGNLQFIHGEFDFIVNKYARPDSTRLQLSPDAWMTEETPSHKTWLNRHIFYQETRRHLSRSLSHRAFVLLDHLFLHLSFLSAAAAAVYSALTARWLLLAFALVMLIAGWVVRTSIGRRAMRCFGVRVGALSYVPFELSLAWRYAGYFVRHAMASKLEFTTHKQ